MPSVYPEPESADAPLPVTVKALGWVSLCTDVSSEMVYPVNPIFLKSLGAAPWVIGLVEGVAEATASLLKLYSGYLSDRTGRRKPLAVTGYALAAVTKPLMGIAGSWVDVFAARFLDRTGKGLRASPRDALIADSVTALQRGRAFGLHRSMDTAGAVVGPLVGYLWLQQFPDSLRTLYFLAFAPGLMGVLILLLFVREARRQETKRTEPPRFTLRGLSPEYRRYLGIVALFGIGNSSDAFLLLRAGEQGVSPAHLLLLYAFFNLVEAGFGYLAGGLSDRVGRRPIIAAGYLMFAMVYLGFALLKGAWAMWPLFLLYGVYYTLTQGAQKALATDLCHPDRRGLEIGAFHLLVGAAALPASLLAGYLYTYVSPAAPFLLGAATALCASLLLLNPGQTDSL